MLVTQERAEIWPSSRNLGTTFRRITDVAASLAGMTTLPKTPPTGSPPSSG